MHGGAGVPGTNLLTSCVGIENLGVVLPADPDPSDDHGSCGAAPPASFATAGDLGIVW
jgi:hypothetical protein